VVETGDEYCEGPPTIEMNTPVSLKPKRFAVFVLTVLLACFFAAPADVEAAAKYRKSFFNSLEKRSKNMKPFKKWRAALARYSKELKRRKDQNCTSTRLNICDYNDWDKFLESLKGKGKWTQLRAVNARMNKAKYISDKANWGRKDYWATPGEFMSRFGDCEDYAIVKYLSLRILGFRESELRVVAVKDLNLKVGHAILMVIVKDKKKKKRYFVLDNQIKKVVEAKKIRHYQPVFSINKNFWWRHQAG